VAVTVPEALQVVRVASYAVVQRDGTVLLARWVSPHGPLWTLPGGGIDHGEDPRDAAVREVEEETGFRVRLDRLLTVDSVRFLIRDADPPLDQHGIRIIYSADVVGGELRDEVGGSTDRAEWVPLARVPGLDRVSLVDVGLTAARAAEALG
jgi:8-oxo-dGTP diphosphatase